MENQLPGCNAFRNSLPSPTLSADQSSSSDDTAHNRNSVSYHGIQESSNVQPAAMSTASSNMSASARSSKASVDISALQADGGQILSFERDVSMELYPTYGAAIPQNSLQPPACFVPDLYPTMSNDQTSFLLWSRSFGDHLFHIRQRGSQSQDSIEDYQRH